MYSGSIISGTLFRCCLSHAPDQHAHPRHHFYRCCLGADLTRCRSFAVYSFHTNRPWWCTNPALLEGEREIGIVAARNKESQRGALGKERDRDPLQQQYLVCHIAAEQRQETATDHIKPTWYHMMEQLFADLSARTLSARHQQRQLSVASEMEELKYEEVSF